MFRISLKVCRNRIPVGVFWHFLCDEIGVGYRFHYMVSICIQMTGMCVLVFLKPIVGKTGSNLSQEDYKIDYSCINPKVTPVLCEM